MPILPRRPEPFIEVFRQQSEEPGNIFSLKHDPVSPKSLKTGGFLYSEVSSCLALSPGEILSFYTSNDIFIKKVFIR